MLNFTKMQGLGNDFLVCEVGASAATMAWEVVAVKLCDRHFGVGADGLLLVGPGTHAPVRMRVINADGSEPEMCGNGLRCVARYARERGLVAHDRFAVETGAGPLEISLQRDVHAQVVGVEVSMGRPRLERSAIPMLGPSVPRVVDEQVMVGDVPLSVSAVSMGNPHAVVFQGVAGEFEEYAEMLEAHPRFPRRANVEFVRVLAPDHLQVRVYERGVGWTMACGTGACAALVAGVLSGRCERHATVELPGGSLVISWPADGEVRMSGPAEVVFTGSVSLTALAGNHHPKG